MDGIEREAVRQTGESSGTKDLVYGTEPYNDENLIILPRSDAEYLRDVCNALASPTWGDLRKIACAATYQEILDLAGYGSLDAYLSKLDVGVPVPGAEEEALRAYSEKVGQPLPADDEPFDAGQIGACADGDFPPDPRLLMFEHLPSDVVEKFGSVKNTVFNGTFVTFESPQRDEILAALETDGYRCTEDQSLIDCVQPEP